MKRNGMLLMKSKEKKKLYQGVFNYQREIHVIYRHGYKKESVKYLMLHELTGRLGLRISTLANYFGGSFDNFKIKEV